MTRQSVTRQCRWGVALAELGRLRSACDVLADAHERAMTHGLTDLVATCEDALAEADRLAGLAPVDQFDRLARVSLRRLTAMVADPRPGRILDAGCGTGAGIALLAQRFPDAAVVGVDRVTTSDHDLVLRPGRGPVHLVTADLLSPLSDSAVELGAFDVVYCHAVLHLVDDSRALLERFHTLLRPGGQLVATCFTDGYFRSVTHLCELLGLQARATPTPSSAHDSIGLQARPTPTRTSPHDAIGISEDLAEVGFEQVRMHTDDVVLQVPEGMESVYLRRLMGRRLSRRELRRILAASDGLDLELHPLTISAYSRC